MCVNVLTNNVAFIIEIYTIKYYYLCVVSQYSMNKKPVEMNDMLVYNLMNTLHPYNYGKCLLQRVSSFLFGSITPLMNGSDTQCG